MKKHNSLIIVILLTIIFFNIYSVYTKKTPKGKTTTLKLTTSYNNKTLNKIVNVNSKDCTDIDIRLECCQDKKAKYEVYVYWDFVQTDFTINNVKYKTYLIDDDSKNYTKNLKIKLNQRFENSFHKLMVVIRDTNYNSEKDSKCVNSIYTFVVDDIQNKKTDISLANPFKTYSNNVKYLNVVNNDFEDNSGKYLKLKDYGKDKILKVAPNTEIELATRFKNFIRDGEQLLFVELNNKQIKINNKPYLNYKLNSSIGFIYDKIKITTPNEPGEYRLITNIVPDPFGKDFQPLYDPDFSYKLIVQ